MSESVSSRRLRWIAPGAVAAAIALAAAGSTVASASAHPVLPARTAAQLLVAVQQARVTGMSGTIVETVKLGLPELPSPPGGDVGLSWQNLLTGSRTLRVWLAGPTQERVALLGALSESDIVRNGQDIWTYSSTTRQVTHVRLAAATTSPMAGIPTAATLTPQQAATQALAAIDPSTAVTVDRTARVADQAAYQLVLTPRDPRTLVRRVQIAVDAATSIPLRVAVYARGSSKPAIQVGFTDVSFHAPDTSVFHFIPPAGATVIQQTPRAALGSLFTGNGVSAYGMSSGHAMGTVRPLGALRSLRGTRRVTGRVIGSVLNGPTALIGSRGSTRLIGSGWTTVFEITGGTSASSLQANPLFGKLATPVPGGELVSTALVSVLFTPDGRVFVGAVSPAALEQVAATGRAL
ncbi:MAG TPA: hypothetical protein VNE21_08590 [Mycobacteriales bacterium]|nr:hypothetical protein [Mycobacteriales bacterium]